MDSVPSHSSRNVTRYRLRTGRAHRANGLPL